MIKALKGGEKNAKKETMRMSKRTNQQPTIPLLDVNLSAFLFMRGLIPKIQFDGTRASFLFEATEEFYKACSEYNQNLPVPCLDFVNALRQLRAAMYRKREGSI